MCLIVDDANNNAVRCWGYAPSGHGNGTTSTNIPVTPTGFTGGVDIASAYYYDDVSTQYTNTCVVKKDKTLWCWGNPHYYSIGTVALATPTRVRFGANLAVSAGALHSCVVRSDGYITCWGGNSSGQLGDNTTTDNNVGVMPTLGNNAVATATGSLHSCALFGDKTAKCWGNNNFGQLGNGSIVQSLIPVSVTGLSTATSITAGKNYTCSLTDSGGVKCWGANDAGQLGNGANTYSYTAVTVQDALGGNLANAVNVVAGELHSCALINDGTVKCWGSNDNSQVGDRTTTNRNQATVVTGLTNVVALSLGYNHTCALISDQTVKCWGANTYGQLGDGSQSTRTAPTAVTSLSNVVALSAGGHTTCALVRNTDDSEALKCWGNGEFGQMGNATTTITNPMPVTVTDSGSLGWLHRKGCNVYKVTSP